MNLPLNTRSLILTNTEEVENIVNSKFAHNMDFDIRNINIFAEVTPYSYIPLKTSISDDGYIRVDNSLEAVSMNLYVGSKHQFLHQRLTMKDDSYKIELTEYFRTAWNPKKYVIFQDGYLMNPGIFTIIIPNFYNSYLKKVIYSTAKFKKGSRIDIYYIEADDNFSQLPISRDVYLGALKYIANINNDRIIKIPYPNKHYKGNQFFIFNENGEYLDRGLDYVVSHDKKYITLKPHCALKLANVDYIIFTFPQLAKDVEYAEDIDDNDITSLLTGSPFFTYSYSIVHEDNESGLVRFIPVFEDYKLTKKNFLLFGNGQWIQPDRYDINDNDSIILLNESDRQVASQTNYTMVIFTDNTDHTERQLPHDYLVLYMESKEDNQTNFKINANIDSRYKSFIIIKDGYIVTNYEYDHDLETIIFDDPIDNFYIIFLSSIVNNTRQEKLTQSVDFYCNPSGPEGTNLPAGYTNIEKNQILLFLNGAYIEPDLYEIKNNKIYLDKSFYTDENDHLFYLRNYKFSLILVYGAYNLEAEQITSDEIQQHYDLQNNLLDNYQHCAYVIHRSSNRDMEDSLIRFNDYFGKYDLDKRNFLLFADNGTFIHPSRYEMCNNNELFMIYHPDQERAGWTTYHSVVFDDSREDEKYSPPNYLIKDVIATEEYQSVFYIPKVSRRFRTFILFRGSMLLNKDYKYEIYDDKIVITDERYYIREGRSLTFVFVDAYSRVGVENRLLQATFSYIPNNTTQLPKNFLTKRFTTDNMIIFLNGLYLTPDKYKIENDEIMIDGYLDLDELVDHTFTIVYMTTIPTDLKEYDFILPTTSDVPIKQRDILDNIYWSYSSSTNTYGKIVIVEPKFTKYSLVKSNFLLFGKNGWKHPSTYEIYSNDRLILDPVDNERVTMAILTDCLDREESLSPLNTLVIDVEVEGTYVEVPKHHKNYKSFIVFCNGKLVDINNYHRLDKDANIIYLRHPITPKRKEKWSFVFLYAYMNSFQQTVFYQQNFTYQGENTKIPFSVFPVEAIDKLHLLFIDGIYKPIGEYISHTGYLNLENVEVGTQLSVVYLVSLIDEDYTEEISIFRPDVGIEDGFHFTYSYSTEPTTRNKISPFSHFSPVFSEYELTSSNCLLFSNGTWISPERFKFLSNSFIEFNYKEDKKKADWTNYTMIIPNEGLPFKNSYKPINIEIKKVTASVDRQKIFTIPEMNENATYLLFVGSLLFPSSIDKVAITENNELLFIKDYDYLDKGRSLYFVILNDSNMYDRRYPIFVQESFTSNIDPRAGTPIPSNWYKYEDYMLVFLGGMYLDKSRYTIESHEIFLTEDFESLTDEEFATYVRDRTYTVVYISAKVLDDHKEEIIEIPTKEEEEIKPNIKPRVIPEDDELDYSGWYFARFTSESNIVEHNGYTQYLNYFEGFDLTKDNFILFANSTWINPSRFNIIDNKTLEFISDEDKRHSDWSHYTMIFPFNKSLFNIHKQSYIKPQFKMVEFIAPKDIKEFELPTIEDGYDSILIFRNSLILPINDEDRFVIDDVTHKFKIRNQEDYIPKGTTVSLIFFKTITNSDQRIVLIQESFSCLGYETHIPNSIKLYENQKFNKTNLLVFLNGTYMDPERYRITNNTIYLAYDDIDFNNDHYYTIVYLEVLNNEELGIETNIVDHTFEEDLDNIIFEEKYAEPYVV